MNKIAIPVKGSKVDGHFGQCEYYMLVSIEDNKVISKDELRAPQGCGCKSGISSVLADAGVSLMLAGNIGQGAINKLGESGVKVIRGCSGEVDKVIEDYISGFLIDSGLTCDHHHTDGTECSH